MSTLSQNTASRANGAKSNGPTSPEGKAASSRNSLKSGLYAKANIIRGEDPEELAALTESYRETFQPDTADTEALVATLIHTEWLQRRMRRVEDETWERHLRDASEPEQDTPIGQASGRGEKDFKFIQRRLDSLDRTYRRTLELLLKLQKQRPGAQPLPAPQPQTSGSFAHSPDEESETAQPPHSPTPDPQPPTPLCPASDHQPPFPAPFRE